MTDTRELIRLVEIAYTARRDYPRVCEAALEVIRVALSVPPADAAHEIEPPLPLKQPATPSPSITKRKRRGAPRWTPQEEAVVSSYRHLKRGEYSQIPWHVVLPQIPRRSKSAAEDKIDDLRAKDEVQAAKQNSAPPSHSGEGQGHSKPEIVDEKAADAPLSHVPEHQVDSAEALSSLSRSVVDPKIIGRPFGSVGHAATVFPEPEPIPPPSLDKLMGSR